MCVCYPSGIQTRTKPWCARVCMCVHAPLTGLRLLFTWIRPGPGSCVWVCVVWGQLGTRRRGESDVMTSVEKRHVRSIGKGAFE